MFKSINPVPVFAGKSLDGWPVHIPHSSVHAKPIRFDVDGDGQLDIIIITSQGQLLGIKPNGDTRSIAQLDTLFVQKDWYEKSISHDQEEIHSFILDEPQHTNDKYLPLDPHVLSDAVIADVNQDGLFEELVLAASYYLDAEDYPLVESVQDVSKHKWDHYLASALVIFNLTSMSVHKTYHLELTSRDLVYPGYIFGSPVVVDLNGTGSLDIIIGSATGKLHVLDVSGKQKDNFPVIVDSIHTDISVWDVNDDGDLELIFIDKSGIVHCIDSSGEPVWETEHEGDSFSSIRIADLVDKKAGVEVILSSDTGYIHVLDGKTGKPIAHWPQKIGALGESSPVVTQLCGDEKKSVVVLASDGHLHFISGDSSCKQTINLGETSLVDLTLLKREDGSQGMLVLTKDGMVMYLAEMTADTKNCTQGALNCEASHIQLQLHNVSFVTGADFEIPYYISGKTSNNSSLLVYLGSKLLYKSESVYKEGIITINAPPTPVSGHVQTIVIDQHKRISVDLKFVHFNTLWKDDVKFVFMFPCLMLAGLLLFGYGFQASELLPFTQQAKDV